MGHNTIISYEFGFDEKCGGELTVNGYGGCDEVIYEGAGKMYDNLCRQH